MEFKKDTKKGEQKDVSVVDDEPLTNFSKSKSKDELDLSIDEYKFIHDITPKKVDNKERSKWMNPGPTIHTWQTEYIDDKGIRYAYPKKTEKIPTCFGSGTILWARRPRQNIQLALNGEIINLRSTRNPTIEFKVRMVGRWMTRGRITGYVVVERVDDIPLLERFNTSEVLH